jgi:hypothetical protein
MAGTAADARVIAESYLILEAAARPEDRSHYHMMANWWQKRAAELAPQSKIGHPKVQSRRLSGNYRQHRVS